MKPPPPLVVTCSPFPKAATWGEEMSVHDALRSAGDEYASATALSPAAMKQVGPPLTGVPVEK